MSEDLINCRGKRVTTLSSLSTIENRGNGGGGGGGERRTNTRRHNSGRLAAGCGRVASDLTGFMENNYLSSALLHSNSARGIRRNFNRRGRGGGDRF